MKLPYQKGTFVVIPNKNALAGLPTHVQTVFFWLCTFADDNGICFPSKTKLASLSGCSIRSVDFSIDFLCEKGLLSKKTRKDNDNPKRNLTNLYQIMIVKSGQDGAGGAWGGAYGAGGVGQEVRSELYPSELNLPKKAIFKKIASPSEFREVQLDSEGNEKKPKVKRGADPAWRVKERLYDMFAENSGKRPTPNTGDYKQVQLALKQGLTEEDCYNLFNDKIGTKNSRTIREIFSARNIDIYRQDYL